MELLLPMLEGKSAMIRRAAPKWVADVVFATTTLRELPLAQAAKFDHGRLAEFRPQADCLVQTQGPYVCRRMDSLVVIGWAVPVGYY